MYACIYVSTHMHTGIHVSVCECEHTNTHTHTHTHSNVCIEIPIYIHTYTHTCTYANIALLPQQTQDHILQNIEQNLIATATLAFSLMICHTHKAIGLAAQLVKQKFLCRRQRFCMHHDLYVNWGRGGGEEGVGRWGDKTRRSGGRRGGARMRNTERGRRMLI